MTWETEFSALPADTRMWMLLGTRRYIAWVQQGRPAIPQFVEPPKGQKIGCPASLGKQPAYPNWTPTINGHVAPKQPTERVQQI